MGIIRYITKSATKEFDYLDNLPPIEWPKFKDQTFYCSGGLNILVVINNNKWQASIERFPSHRKDAAAGRNIYSTIEAEGISGDYESRKIYNLICFILLQDRDLIECGKRLNELFTTDFVEQALNNKQDTKLSSKAVDNLNSFFSDLPKPTKLNSNDYFINKRAEVTDITDGNIYKLLNSIKMITEENCNNVCKIFAVNDLPYEKSNLEYITNEYNNTDTIVILTKADSRLSINIDVIKKKTSTLPVPIPKKSPSQSKIGLSKTLIITVILFGISLICNIIIWKSWRSSKNSLSISQKEILSLKQSKDSLNHLVVQNLAINELLKRPKFVDKANNGNIVIFNVDEFLLSGCCELITYQPNKNTDTIIIRSNVDFGKGKMILFNAYKNSVETKPLQRKIELKEFTNE